MPSWLLRIIKFLSDIHFLILIVLVLSVSSYELVWLLVRIVRAL
jgi:hypothetical protein